MLHGGANRLKPVLEEILLCGAHLLLELIVEVRRYNPTDNNERLYSWEFISCF
jgi:hypothetical protein